MADPERVFPEAGLAYRIRRPPAAADRGVLLLHGLGGDEDVMWVFERVLPEGWIAVAPRGPFAAAEGGWSWTRAGKEHLSTLPEFNLAVEGLRFLLAGMRTDLGVREDTWVWMGFSQGAALAFAAAFASGIRPAGVVSLSGFLPEGFEAEALERRGQVPVYWGHGTQDDQVPVERARRDVARLREAGLDVTYCESDVGHKLGADCLRGLKAWFARDGAAPKPKSES